MHLAEDQERLSVYDPAAQADVAFDQAALALIDTLLKEMRTS